MSFVSLYEDISERAEAGKRINIIPSGLLNWGPRSIRSSASGKLISCGTCKRSLPRHALESHIKHHKETKRLRAARRKESDKLLRELRRRDNIALKNRMRVLERAGLPRMLTVEEKRSLPPKALEAVQAWERQLKSKAHAMLVEDRQRLYALAHGPIGDASH